MTRPTAIPDVDDPNPDNDAEPRFRHLFRIVARRFADQPFSGEHCRQGGRWSSPGVQLAYASASPGGALLEHLANGGSRARHPVVLVRARLPQSRWPALADPPRGWRARPYSQRIRSIGDQWIESGRSLAMLVPSALVEEEWNVLVNPEHADFGRLRVETIRPVVIDPRLRPGGR